MTRGPWLALVLLSACPAARAPEARVEEALAAVRAAGFTATLPDGAEVQVAPGALSYVAVTGIAAEGLEGTARLTVEGLAGGVPFSYLGSERFPVRCRQRCELDGVPAPRMIGVLSALRARRAALAEGDLDALRALAAPGVRIDEARLSEEQGRAPAAWFVKVERGEAVVGEAAADGKQHPFSLREEGGRWVFTAGLP